MQMEFLSFSTYYFRVAFSDGLHDNFISIVSRAQSRGRFGRNNCPRGRNFVLNWAQGEVGASVFSFIPQQNEKKSNANSYTCNLEFSSNHSTNQL